MSFTPEVFIDLTVTEDTCPETQDDDYITAHNTCPEIQDDDYITTHNTCPETQDDDDCITVPETQVVLPPETSEVKMLISMIESVVMCSQCHIIMKDTQHAPVMLAICGHLSCLECFKLTPTQRCHQCTTINFDENNSIKIVPDIHRLAIKYSALVQQRQEEQEFFLVSIHPTEGIITKYVWPFRRTVDIRVSRDSIPVHFATGFEFLISITNTPTNDNVCCVKVKLLTFSICQDDPSYLSMDVEGTNSRYRVISSLNNGIVRAKKWNDQNGDQGNDFLPTSCLHMYKVDLSIPEEAILNNVEIPEETNNPEFSYSHIDSGSQSMTLYQWTRLYADLVEQMNRVMPYMGYCQFYNDPESTHLSNDNVKLERLSWNIMAKMSRFCMRLKSNQHYVTYFDAVTYQTLLASQSQKWRLIQSIYLLQAFVRRLLTIQDRIMIGEFKTKKKQKISMKIETKKRSRSPEIQIMSQEFSPTTPSFFL